MENIVADWDKRNGDVVFYEKEHLYKNIRYPYIKYTSVTTLISNYYEHFDKEFWSSYGAIKNIMGEKVFKSSGTQAMMLDIKQFKEKWLDMLGIIKDEFEKEKQNILDEWDRKNKEACEWGTEYHLQRENYFYTKDKFKIGNLIGDYETEFVCEKHNFDLSRENAILPEYLIHYSSKDGMVNLSGQIDLLVKRGNDIFIYDYKGLALDTPIPTIDGYKPMRKIKVGDIIFDGNGKQTKVKHVSKIHYNPCYKIKFDNNDEIICDHEHRWEVDFFRSKGNYKTKELTTDELYNIVNDNKKRGSYHIPKVKIFDELELEERDLPLDPYILGAWLGDGSKACGVITNVNKNFWKEVEKRGFKVSHDLNHGGDQAEMRTVYGISPILRSLGLINNKHIPEMYLRASKKQRLDLLRGLMDTDGYFNTTRNRFVMGTTQKWQAEDTAKLVATFGVKPTIIKCIKKCEGKEFNGFDVCFYMNDNPFLIRNQDININIQITSYSKCRNIISIEKIDMVPTKCLAVESEAHTYLAGYNLIKTHNTNAKGIDNKAFYDKKLRKTKKMKYPVNNLDDHTLNHYTLQLSLYAYMLQQINPNFNIKMLKLLHKAKDSEETEIEVPYLKDECKRIFIDTWKRNKIEYEKEILNNLKG